jgi:hypothetical protein
MVEFPQLMERISMRYFYTYHQHDFSHKANISKEDLLLVYEPMSFQNNRHHYQLFHSNDQVYIEINVIDKGSRQDLLLTSTADQLD